PQLLAISERNDCHGFAIQVKWGEGEMRRRRDVGYEVVKHSTVRVGQRRKHVCVLSVSRCQCLLLGVARGVVLRFGRPSAVTSLRWTTCSLCNRSTNEA